MHRRVDGFLGRIMLLGDEVEQYLRADLLVDSLLKLLIVQDGSHLPIAVAGPEGGVHLHLRLAHILPGEMLINLIFRSCDILLCIVLFWILRNFGLSFGFCRRGFIAS